MCTNSKEMFWLIINDYELAGITFNVIGEYLYL